MRDLCAIPPGIIKTAQGPLFPDLGGFLPPPIWVNFPQIWVICLGFCGVRRLPVRCVLGRNFLAEKVNFPALDWTQV